MCGRRCGGHEEVQANATVDASDAAWLARVVAWASCTVETEIRLSSTGMYRPTMILEAPPYMSFLRSKPSYRSCAQIDYHAKAEPVELGYAFLRAVGVHCQLP